MSRVLLLAFAVALASHAQVGKPEFRSRYGGPYIQRYRIDSQLTVAVRYDDSGVACAFQIAPSNFTSVALSDAPTSAIDLVVDRFVPGYLAQRDRRSATDDAVSDTEEFGGWRIRHQRPYPFDPQKTSLAEMTADAECSHENRISLQLEFGSPEYERFRARPGLALSATYARDGSLKRIDIRRYSVALNDEPYSGEQKIDVTAAEQVLDDILTPAIRKALVPGFVRITGPVGQETSTYGAVVVSRDFSIGTTGGVLGYSVSWR